MLDLPKWIQEAIVYGKGSIDHDEWFRFDALLNGIKYPEKKRLKVFKSLSM